MWKNPIDPYTPNILDSFSNCLWWLSSEIKQMHKIGQMVALVATYQTSHVIKRFCHAIFLQFYPPSIQMLSKVEWSILTMLEKIYIYLFLFWCGPSSYLNNPNLGSLSAPGIGAPGRLQFSALWQWHEHKQYFSRFKHYTFWHIWLVSKLWHSTVTGTLLYFSMLNSGSVSDVGLQDRSKSSSDTCTNVTHCSCPSTLIHKYMWYRVTNTLYSKWATACNCKSIIYTYMYI